MNIYLHRLSLPFKGGFLPIIGALLLIGFGASPASAQVLTYYNFNDGPTSGQAATTAELTSDTPSSGSYPALQQTTISTNFPIAAAGAANTGIGSLAGSTVNALGGDTAGLSLAVIGGTGATTGGTGGNNGDYIQFTLNTTGFSNLSLSYASQRTTTGFSQQLLQYSIDGGTTFTTFATNTAIPTAFATQTFSLETGNATDPSPDNQSSLLIRFTFTGATSSSGNNRIDNLQVAQVPEPATLFGGVLLVGAAGWSQRRRLKALCPSALA